MLKYSPRAKKSNRTWKYKSTRSRWALFKWKFVWNFLEVAFWLSSERSGSFSALLKFTSTQKAQRMWVLLELGERWKMMKTLESSFQVIIHNLQSLIRLELFDGTYSYSTWSPNWSKTSPTYEIKSNSAQIPSIWKDEFDQSKTPE